MSLTFAKKLVLNPARASKTGKWFVAHDNSFSVPLNIKFLLSTSVF